MSMRSSAAALVVVLLSGGVSWAQVFDQSATIDSPMGAGPGGIVIRSDGTSSPTIKVVDGGALISEFGVYVSDESTLVLNGGFLGNTVRVIDEAKMIYRSGQVKCVAGSCGDVPGLLSTLVAEDNATLDIFATIQTTSLGGIPMSGNSTANIYGEGLAVLRESTSFGARVVLIGSPLLIDGSRELFVVLRLRDNASFELREIPEPSSAALAVICCVAAIRTVRRPRAA